jgi:hypothetical protein
MPKGRLQVVFLSVGGVYYQQNKHFYQIQAVRYGWHGQLLLGGKNPYGMMFSSFFCCAARAGGRRRVFLAGAVDSTGTTRCRLALSLAAARGVGDEGLARQGWPECLSKRGGLNENDKNTAALRLGSSAARRIRRLSGGLSDGCGKLEHL